MKKFVLSFLAIVLMTIICCTFTGCGQNKNEQSDQSSQSKEIEFKDNNSGYTLKLKVPVDSQYVVQNIDQDSGRFAKLTMVNKEKNVELQMYYFESTDTSYENIKNDRSKTEGFKEYKWNKYDGYSYLGDKYSVSFNVYLRGENDENRAVCIFGSLEYTDIDKANVLETFNSDEFQKIMNSMEFSE